MWTLLATVVVLLKSFILPAILGAICALLLYKPTKLVETKLKNYKLSVLLTTTVCGLMFFLPLMILGFSGATEIIAFIKQGNLSSLNDQIPELIKNYLPKLQALLPINLEVIHKKCYPSYAICHRSWSYITTKHDPTIS